MAAGAREGIIQIQLEPEFGASTGYAVCVYYTGDGDSTIFTCKANMALVRLAREKEELRYKGEERGDKKIKLNVTFQAK